MDTILKNETLNKVMNFISNNIWIIGLLLAIIVVIILIIIFSKKRPVEIESIGNDNVGDLMNVNSSLENSTNIINNEIVNEQANADSTIESLNGENLESPVIPVTEETDININEAETSTSASLEPTTLVNIPEEVSTINAASISSEPEISNVANTEPTPASTPANVVEDNPINNVPEVKEDLNAFDLPMPAQNTEVINNYAAEPKEETLTETLEEEPVKVETPENFDAPEVTNLEDTLELPKMANEAINENITATKKCPNCGHDNPYSYKVCVKCGTILE
jgi:hypothetical protein